MRTPLRNSPIPSGPSRLSGALVGLFLIAAAPAASAQFLLDHGAIPDGSGRLVTGSSLGDWTVFQPFDVEDEAGWCVETIGIAGWIFSGPLVGFTLDVCPDDGSGAMPDCSDPIGTASHHLENTPQQANWTDAPYGIFLEGNRRYWAVVRSNGPNTSGAVFHAVTGLPSYSMSTTAGGPWPGSAVALRIRGQVFETPVAYCEAKPNSLGCSAAVEASGIPSASRTSGFVVAATQVRNRRPGLLFYSVTGRSNAPFQGGVLCVRPPVQRTPAVGSNGNALPAADCSGRLSLDLNAFASGLLGGAPAPELSTPGTRVTCQWWGRDAGDPFGTMLSDALEYVVCP